MKYSIKIIKIFFADVRKVLIAIFITSLLTGGAIYIYFKEIMDTIINVLLSPTPLWLTCLLIITCCLINYLLIRVYIKKTPPYKSQEELYEKFGAYWNKDYNLRCLGCKAPLKNSSQNFGPMVFFCSRCNHKHTLRNDNGEIITHKQAVDKLKESPFFKGFST